MKNMALCALAVCCILFTVPAIADETVYVMSAGSDGVQQFNINIAAGTETLVRHIGQGGPNGLTPGGNGRGVVVVGDTMYYTYANSANVYSYNLATSTDNGVLFTVAGASGLATASWDGSHLLLGDYSGTDKVYTYTLGGALVSTVDLSKCAEVHQGGTRGFCDGLTFRSDGKLVSNEGDGGFGGPSQYDVYDITGGTPVQTGLITTSYGATGIAFDNTNYIVSDIFHDQLGIYDASGNFVKFIALADGDHTFAIEEVSVNFNQVLNPTPEPAMYPVLAAFAVGLVALRRKFSKGLAG